MVHLFSGPRLPVLGRKSHDLNDNNWEQGRSPKRQKTTRSSHGFSLLRPITRIVRSPLDTMEVLAETIGQWSQQDQSVVRLSETEQEIEIKHAQLASAKTCEEWESAAAELDRLEGRDQWKEEEESEDYDVEIIKAKITELETARDSGDVKTMLWHIRTALGRDVGGIGNPRLFQQSRVGTKRLVERYIETATDTIDTAMRHLVRDGHDGWSAYQIKNMMLRTRQAFGRTALLLSGGGTHGMCHFGVVKTLFEADVLPRILSGSSAGSIVAAVCAANTDEDLPKVINDFCYGDLAVFERDTDIHQGFGKFLRLFTVGSFYDINNLIHVMKCYLGDLTFLEAYNKTHRILNICVSAESSVDQSVLLNYVTTPNVLIWSAVAASCSVPVMYSPAKLYEKSPLTQEIQEFDKASQRRFIDGSVVSDLPRVRLSEMFDVNHFIACQVNPHIVPFVAKEADLLLATDTQTSAISNLDTVVAVAKSEMLHRFKMATDLGIFPKLFGMLHSVLDQTYYGDITIIPDIPYKDRWRFLANPDTEFLQRCIPSGERATWSKLSRIKSRCAIERALERAVAQSVSRAVFSPSQVNLRLNRFSEHPLMLQMQKRGSRSTSSRRHERHKSVFVARDSLMHRSLMSMRDMGGRRGTVHVVSNHPTEDSGSDEESARSRSRSPSRMPGFEVDDTEHALTDSSIEAPPSPKLGQWPAVLGSSLSQPVTPTVRFKNFSFSPASNDPELPMLSAAPALVVTPSETTESNFNPMDAVAVSDHPSSPEQRYKRFFHDRSRALSPMLARNSTPSPPLSTTRVSFKSNKFGMHIPLEVPERTRRGRLRSLSRSRSTGMSGLQPPRKQ